MGLTCRHPFPSHKRPPVVNRIDRLSSRSGAQYPYLIASPRIVPLRRRGYSKGRRAASSLVRLVEGVERWETPDHLQGPWSLKTGVEPSQVVLSPVWCSKLRITTGVPPALCHDEFRGPRSDTVR
ncbi:hypothetical protein TNCV_712671 [Trichonephila clavipes]|nr:hypothetical protein TNCV_712671 [Trichonephila clavipes]